MQLAKSQVYLLALEAHRDELCQALIRHLQLLPALLRAPQLFTREGPVA